MKKLLILFLFGAGLVMGFSIKPVVAQTTQPPYVEDGGGDTTAGPSGTTVFKIYSRRRVNISFDLWLATRGATDSLLVTLQTTNAIQDTSSWQTLTNFGGIKTVVGHTSRTFTPEKDSTQFIGHFLRFLQRHSIDTVVVADTSTFKIQTTEWGDKLE